MLTIRVNYIALHQPLVLARQWLSQSHQPCRLPGNIVIRARGGLLASLVHSIEFREWFVVLSQLLLAV